MTLAETQALFAEAIAGGTVDEARLAACFAGTPALPAAARLGIYAGMYRARLEAALADTFPALARLLGPERFGALAADYAARHPSESPDIGDLGRALPAFLAEHPAPERGDLADLAALEWARHRAFFAADAAPDREALARLPPEAAGEAVLALAPGLRLLRLGHEVARPWRHLDALAAGAAEGAPPGPEPGAFAVAVWREGYEVVHATLAPAEADALEAALAGEPLAAICAAFGDAPDPAAAAHAALSAWLADGWITGASAPGTAAA